VNGVSLNLGHQDY